MISHQAKFGQFARRRGFIRLVEPIAPALGVLAAVAVVYGTVRVADRREQPITPIELMSVHSVAEQADALNPLQAVIQAEPAVAALEPMPVPVAPVAEAPATVPVVASEPVVLPQPHTGPMFNGRPLRKVRTLSMLVTAYSPDERSCGIWADGVTASGYSVWTNGMRLVAADTRLLPFGTIITVPGYNDGKPVPVLDRGGKIKGHRLDVLYATHEQALRWGKKRIDVDVWEYAD